MCMTKKHKNKIRIMGVINATPDSFSDGGLFLDLNQAQSHARTMIESGADILDIGGESTRPGADIVTVEQELERTIPLIKKIREFSDITISIDTSKAEVMSEAIAAGADMINDICALSQPDSAATAAKLNVPVCLMHMQGNPRNMQNNPNYQDVVQEVKEFLQRRINIAVDAGIRLNNIIIDPGFGFGKNLQQNLQLLNALPKLKSLGCSILVGLSRKRMIGTILGKPVEDRLYGSISTAIIAAMKGADIVRVHDVAETADALAIVEALQQAS